MLKYLVVGSLLFSSSLVASWNDVNRVKVTKHIAITKPYTEKIQVGEQCYQDTVEVNVRCNERENTNTIGVDTIIGGIAGVAIGNQIGKGSGRQAAKVLGGITGAVTANQIRNTKTCKSYETVTKCNPNFEYRTMERKVGYNNCATFNGQEICVQTKDPINYIRVEQTYTVHPE